jgi:hypothetical protein
MSSLFAQFATNRKAEVEGVEVTFGGDAVFRIARMSKSNKRYQKMLEQETKPHIHAIRNENLSPEIDDQITMKIFIATILLEWKGVEAPELFTMEEHSIIDQGAAGLSPVKRYVPFTPENATKLFKALPELYIALKDNAQKMSLFRAEEIETDSKT